MSSAPTVPDARGSSLATVALTFGLFLYAAVLEPFVARSLFDGTQASSAWVWLLFAVIVLEGWAWCVLAPPPAATAPGEVADDTISVWLFFLLFGRTAVEVLMIFGALTAAGHAIEDSLGMIGTLLIVLKFLVCLFALMTPASAPPPRRRARAQLVALAWSCLAYTMSWGRILAADRGFVGMPVGEAIVESFAALLLFLLLYCPIRVHAVLAVQRGQRTVGQELLVVAGVGFVSIASLWGYDAWWVEVVLAAFGGR